MKFKRLISGACAFALLAGMLGAPETAGRALPGTAVAASAAGELKETDIHVNIYCINYQDQRDLIASCDVTEKVTTKKTRYVFNTGEIVIDSTKIKYLEYEFSIPDLASDQQASFNGYLSYHFFNADYDAAGAGVGKDELQTISPEKLTSTFTWKELFANDPHDYTLMSLGGQILNFTPSKYVPPTTPITTAKVTVSNRVYTGKAVAPAPTVVLDGKTLKRGTDYTVAYKDNIKVGRATCTVTGINDYRGKKLAFFYVTPAKVTAKKLTSPKTKTVKFVWVKDTQVTGYNVQIALNKTFTKGVKKYDIKNPKTVSKTVKGLKKGKKYYARVQGYAKIGQRTFEGNWSKVLKVKCK